MFSVGRCKGKRPVDLFEILGGHGRRRQTDSQPVRANCLERRFGHKGKLTDLFDRRDRRMRDAGFDQDAADFVRRMLYGNRLDGLMQLLFVFTAALVGLEMLMVFDL